jgi:hypothetical protein
MRTIPLAAIAAVIATSALAEPADCTAGIETPCHIAPGQSKTFALKPGQDEDWIKLDKLRYGKPYIVIIRGVGQALPANIMNHNGQLFGTPYTSKVSILLVPNEDPGPPLWVRVRSPIGMAGKYTVVYRRK